MTDFERSYMIDRVIEDLKGLGYNRVGTTTRGGYLLQEDFFNDAQVRITVSYEYMPEGKRPNIVDDDE